MDWSFLSKINPFSKTIKIRCPDGSFRTVQKNIDDALPLYIPGWKGSADGKVSGKGEITGSIGGSYETRIQGLVFSLNETNDSLMFFFRAAYVSYMSDPCTNSKSFDIRIERIIEESNKQKRISIGLRNLRELSEKDPVKAGQLYQSLIDQLGGANVAEGATMEILESNKRAQKWIEGDKG